MLLHLRVTLSLSLYCSLPLLLLHTYYRFKERRGKGTTDEVNEKKEEKYSIAPPLWEEEKTEVS